MTDPVLKIEDLHLSFPIFRGEVHALNHVSLEIGPRVVRYLAERT